MIYLFNNNEEMIRIIPNSAIKRMYQTQKLTDENYISDRLDVEIQALNDEELSELEYMAIDDIENPQRFHYYFIVKETTEHQVTSLTGVQSGIEELRKTPVYDMRPTNLSPKLIADRLLKDTNWQAGYTTNDVGTISTNFYYTDVFSALKKMCMAFGIEMQFFVEITTNRIGARYIEFRKQTGKSVGKRVVYGHNALKIVKEVEKTNTVTALIGRGKGVQVSESSEGNIGYGRKVGIENVEWKTSSGAPVDKPLGQEYVEIPDLTLQYGIKNSNGTVRPKIGFVEFQDEESETRLIDRTYNALLELSRPQVLLETSSVYLPDTGIGDTINVVRHDRDLRYQTRVFEITWDRLANQAVDMKLGDRLGESENKRISNISNQISGNISTELGPTIDELIDRITSADGKNTNWYTEYDPMENPETMGLVRVNDNWYQPDPEFEGEFILKQWNGEMWVEILRTSGNPELVRRFEEIEQQAQGLADEIEASEARAAEKANQALQDAKDWAEAEDARIKQEIGSEVASAQSTADSAVNQIDTAVANAGFTSLDDTLQNMNDITSGIKSELDIAVQNAGFTSLDEMVSDTRYLGETANSNAQTAISEAQTAQANSLMALGQSGDALTGVSNLNVRVNDVEDELELKADNTYMTEDGTLTTLSNAITFNAHRFNSDMQRIESRVEGLAGEINLVILSDAFEGTRLVGNESYPNPSTGSGYNTSDTMRELISVEEGEQLALSKNTVDMGYNYWTYNYYDDNHNYIGRSGTSANEYILTIPSGVSKLWVSYPKGSQPQIVRGTEFVPYRPNLADQMTSDEVRIFRNEYDEFAEGTQRRITAIDGSGGRLETAETLINQTAEGLSTTVGRIDNQEERISTVEQTASGLQTTVADKASIAQVTQVAEGLDVLVKSKPKNIVNNGDFSNGYAWWSFGTNIIRKKITENRVELDLTTDSSAIGGNLNRIWNTPQLQSGKKYRMTFDAYTYASGRVISIGQAGSQNMEEVALSNEVRSYEVIFEADRNSSLSIYFHEAGTYEIGNIVVVETSAISQAQLSVLNDSIISTVYDEYNGRISTVEQIAEGLQTTVADKANQSQVTQLATGLNALVQSKPKNIIRNGDFSNGYTLWSFGTNIIAKRIIENRLELDLTTNSSATSGGVNRFWSYDQLQSGKKYRITFDAHTFSSGRVVTVGQDGSNNIEEVVLSNDVHSYEVIYEATRNGSLSFYLHESGTYQIGNIEVVETNQVSQAQISVLNNNINLRVKEGDVLSQINVEAERTLIQSNKLVLDANSVVFTGSAFIPSAQIQSIHASKITAGEIETARLKTTEIVSQGLSGNEESITQLVIGEDVFTSSVTNLAQQKVADELEQEYKTVTSRINNVTRKDGIEYGTDTSTYRYYDYPLDSAITYGSTINVKFIMQGSTNTGQQMILEHINGSGTVTNLKSMNLPTGESTVSLTFDATQSLLSSESKIRLKIYGYKSYTAYFEMWYTKDHQVPIEGENTGAISSQITQLYNMINLSILGKDGAMSRIAMGEEGIQIDGKLLHITAKTYIDEAVIKSAMIDTLDAGKITTGELNASLIRVVNLDANSIVGNEASFIRAMFSGTISTLQITSDGVSILDNLGRSSTHLDSSGIEFSRQGVELGKLEYVTNTADSGDLNNMHGFSMRPNRNSYFGVSYFPTASATNSIRRFAVSGRTGNVYISGLIKPSEQQLYGINITWGTITGRGTNVRIMNHDNTGGIQINNGDLSYLTSGGWRSLNDRLG